MADARICDRCKKIFAAEKLSFVGLNDSVIISLDRIELSDDDMKKDVARGRVPEGYCGSRVELCRECREDLEHWYNSFEHVGGVDVEFVDE